MAQGALIDISIDVPGSALRDGTRTRVVVHQHHNVFEAELPACIGFGTQGPDAMLDLANQLEHVVTKLRSIAKTMREKR